MNIWGNTQEKSTQDHELDFWLNDNFNCANTFIEDRKQFEIYSLRLKLNQTHYKIELDGKSVIDIGSGPTSILLKSQNYSKAFAVDPLMDKFPGWVKLRYLENGIRPVTGRGEDVELEKVDMVLCYNVLQHTIDPEQVINNMKKLGNEIRIFEWINIPADDKHPHVLKADLLDKWLGGKGITEHLNEPYIFSEGECYYNVI